MHRTTWKMKCIVTACTLSLMYGAIAPLWPASQHAAAAGNATEAVHPFHNETVRKTFTYDANGNHVGTDSAFGNERKTYDVLNRLIRYEGPDGVEEYTYIGAGAKRHSVTRTPTGGEPETTSYLYDHSTRLKISQFDATY